MWSYDCFISDGKMGRVHDVPLAGVIRHIFFPAFYNNAFCSSKYFCFYTHAQGMTRFLIDSSQLRKNVHRL